MKWPGADTTKGFVDLRTGSYNSRSSMGKFPKPTGAELTILRVLWQRGPSTVRQVHQALNEVRETGYTTVLKFMQIMHEKGLVSRDETPYAHVYQARLPQAQAERTLVADLLDQAFEGSMSRLLLQALSYRDEAAINSRYSRHSAHRDSVSEDTRWRFRSRSLLYRDCDASLSRARCTLRQHDNADENVRTWIDSHRDSKVDLHEPIHTTSTTVLQRNNLM
jgi:predicted transcriptional regulator